MKVYLKLWLITLVLLVVLVIQVRTGHAAGPWYVVPGGNDGNSCLSPAAACATINGALNKPGFVATDTIFVATGTYTGTGSEVVLLNKNATLSGGWNISFTTQNGMSTIDGQGARRGITVNNGVTATIEWFTVENGFVTVAGGGGIYNDGALTLNSTVVNSNKANTWGGGIYNTGTLTITDSTISNNETVSGNGCGIFNTGVLIIRNSTINNNKGTGGGGGGISNGGTASLFNSSVNNNTPNSGGGGILNFANMTINNSTISGNISQSSAGGGGIKNENGATITLNNSTISNNIAANGGVGGGLVNDGTAILRNTIIAGNVAPSAGPDCSYVVPGAGVINSMGYNLIGNTSNCNFTSATGDLTNIDPKLGPLEGSPGYYPLLSGSPAINAGNPAGCMGSSGPLTTDQRGSPRIGRCDIGAYEAPPLTLSAKTVNPSAALPGNPLAYTISLNNRETINITNVRVTDTLPISVTYIANSLSATSGSYGYSNGVISWIGTVNAGGAVNITFAATVNQATPLGTTIVNSAVISGGGEIFTRTTRNDGYTFPLSSATSAPTSSTTSATPLAVGYRVILARFASST